MISIATSVSLSSYCATLLPIQQGIVIADATDYVAPRKDILSDTGHILSISFRVV
jgi:hypothetical protein